MTDAASHFETRIDTLERDGAAIAYAHTPRTAAGTGPGVLFCPGFMSDMAGSKALALEAWAVERGIAFTRFDYQGHGASGGKFTDGTIGLWADDALAVLERVCAGADGAGRTVVVGSSMGGWIALLLARRRPDLIAGLVGIAAAPDFTQDLMWETFGDDAKREIMENGVWMRPSEYPEYDAQPITRALIEDGRRHSIFAAPHPFAGPTRLLQGQRDPDVPWETALRIADHLAASDVRTTLIKDGDHRLSRPQDLALLTATVAELTSA